MKRIMSFSRHVLTALHLALIAIPAYVILSWALINRFAVTKVMLYSQTGLICSLIKALGINVVQANAMVTIDTVVLPLAQFIGFLGSVVAYIPMYLACLLLVQLFKNYSLGEVFNQANVLCFRRLGYLFFLNGLLIEPLSGTLNFLSATICNPAGQRCIQISFGYPTLQSLMCGGFILIISWVMQEALELKTQADLTV